MIVMFFTVLMFAILLRIVFYLDNGYIGAVYETPHLEILLTLFLIMLSCSGRLTYRSKEGYAVI
jgi:hypothetical protein